MTRLGLKRKLPHYKCKKCGFVISFRELHLQKYHDSEINEEVYRHLEVDDPLLLEIFSEWFEETNEPYTHSIYILNKNYR